MNIKYKIFGYSLALIFFLQANFAEADVLGGVINFFVNEEFTKNGQSMSNATLMYVGNKAFYYVDNDYLASLDSQQKQELNNSLKELSKEYDDRIYPILTRELGTLREPGIDREIELYVLLLPLQEGAGGYINTADGFFKNNIKDGKTNEKELIYLNVDLMGRESMKGFFAHEVQHLITFYNKDIEKKISDDVWLNELRSEYVIDLLGYNDVFSGSFLEARLSVFLESGSDSLTEWKNEPLDYAMVSLFGEYLFNNYNKEIFRYILQSDKVGIESIDFALKSMGYEESFLDVFRNWQIANYINDRKNFGAEFGYLHEVLNFKIKPNISYDISNGYSSNYSYSKKDWQPFLIEYKGFSDFLNIEFKSILENAFDVSYIVNRNDGSVLINKLPLYRGQGVIRIEGLGSNVKNIILMPTAIIKRANFTNNEEGREFSISVSTNNESSSSLAVEAVFKNVPDGSLVRPAWDYKVYVVKGSFLRHIIDERVLSLYDSSNIRVLSREEFNPFKYSSLIRAVGDYKVYELDERGNKRWLNMTAEDFKKSGRLFLSVFEISREELNLYNTGSDITI